MLLVARWPVATLLVGAAGVIGCGGRSQLHDSIAGPAAAGDGAGGSSSTSSASTSSTTGGSGGAPPACQALVLSGPPITYEPSSSEHGSRPSLVPATDDGALVSVVFLREPLEGPYEGPSRVASATLSPWGSWPSSLGPEDQAVGFFGDPFAAAPAMPEAQPGFSVLFYLPTNSFPSDMFLAPAVATGTSYDPFPAGVSWDAWEPAWPSALARGASGHLAAYQLGMGPSSYLSVALVDAPSGDMTVMPEVACASAPFTVDAIPAAGGFLVATATGRPFGACPLDDGIPGPATELDVIRLDQETMTLSLAASFEEIDPIAHVALAPRADGAWLVWQSTGASAESPPPIQAVPLDEQGAPAGAVFSVTGSGQTTGPFAAAALGARLAVAWIDWLDPSSPTIRLDLFDEEGAFVSGASLGTSGAWLYDASLALLASPDGTALLASWADESDQPPPAPATVRVARFACTGAP